MLIGRSGTSFKPLSGDVNTIAIEYMAYWNLTTTGRESLIVGEWGNALPELVKRDPSSKDAKKQELDSHKIAKGLSDNVRLQLSDHLNEEYPSLRKGKICLPNWYSIRTITARLHIMRLSLLQEKYFTTNTIDFLLGDNLIPPPKSTSHTD